MVMENETKPLSEMLDLQLGILHFYSFERLKRPHWAGMDEMNSRCTTHFHACDCREEHFKALEEKLRITQESWKKSEAKLNDWWKGFHKQEIDKLEEKLRVATEALEKISEADTACFHELFASEALAKIKTPKLQSSAQE